MTESGLDFEPVRRTKVVSPFLISDQGAKGGAHPIPMLSAQAMRGQDRLISAGVSKHARKQVEFRVTPGVEQIRIIVRHEDVMDMDQDANG